MGFFNDRDDLGPPPDMFRFGRGEGSGSISVKWFLVAGLAILSFIGLSTGKTIFANVLWFESVGFQGVYSTLIVTKLVLFAIGFAIAATLLGLNVWLAKRFAPDASSQLIEEGINPQSLNTILTVIASAITIFLAILFGVALSSGWEQVLLWSNGVPFNLEDAQFSKDLSFYTFDLPFFRLIHGWVTWLIIISGVLAGAIYGLALFGSSVGQFSMSLSRPMRAHVSVLAGLLLLMFTLGTYFDIFDLVNKSGGIIYGATYTDVNARLPAMYIIILLGLFAGVVTIANAFLAKSGFQAPIFAVGIWIAASVIGGAIYPSTVQSLQVSPNERAKEETYIARNIAATRYAYGLDGIDERQYPANETVTPSEFAANPKTLKNVRLLDPIPVRDTFNQIQGIRQLYLFKDVDVDRYEIEDEVRQVMISARELDIQRAPDSNWTRERLQYTHGYGAVISPVNEFVVDEGLPVLWTSDIPPVSDVLPLSETGARIYFGELTNHPVVGNSNEPEFDYPEGEGNVTTRYQEDRGIQLNSLAKRLALAWELSDWNLLISGQITSESRLLMKRNIKERIDAVAPFVMMDSDPYLVTIDEELVWIVPGYTSTNAIPYSQPRGNGAINYIRNSVVTTVDAQTGDITFYLIDEVDPIINSWAKIFPDLFTSQDEMPASIREHLRYPPDLFKLQRDLYLRYHITDPTVFFLSEDLWNIPTERFHRTEQPVEPYFVLMTLPDKENNAVVEEQVEFVLMTPFTPLNRRNTIAWLAGRSDGEHYGELVSYRFPTDSNVLGPGQIESLIDQDPVIAQQLTLWDQAGSEVIRGNLLMIPVGSSFLFVEPIYLQAEASRLPQLQRVVAANGNQIVMEKTLPLAIEVLLGQRPSSLDGKILQNQDGDTGGTDQQDKPVITSGLNLRDLLNDAKSSTEQLEKEIAKLRELIDALQEALEQVGE
ncbi:MAG: UPF0182 family protein [Chloroflexota bacterium]|jgi:uncharacterized membrane protein (UPF0182 family)|nr:UPF0182 family protein [Chloroflexota bacterium]